MEHQNKRYGDTCFTQTDKHIWLNELAGLTCGFGGKDEGPLRAKGLFTLHTSIGNFNVHSFPPVESTFDKTSVHLVWKDSRHQLQLESDWSYCESAGIWSRQDRLTNIGSETIFVFRCQAQFVFSPALYEMYIQESNWCLENQGQWLTVPFGKTTIGCVGGRTCHHAAPYLAIREQGGSRGAAFHIIPRGNWEFEVSSESLTVGNIGHYFAVIRAGQSDEHMDLKLKPGECFELPELLIQSLPGGDVESGSAHFHRYWLGRVGPAMKRPPVLYNTWFDDFEILNVDRLRRHVKTAKELGFELFVLDAGWYGQSEGYWWQQCGDWREKLDGAFRGKLKDFAEEVRQADLGFGIWMEAEIIDSIVPVVKNHPEWILAGNGCYYYDLENEEAWNYLFNEISRVIDTYRAVFVKIDFNREIGIDPHGSELAGYYESWYRMLDALGEKYPQVFFENCSSGGMRSDLNTLSHFNMSFLSDVADPVKMLRIFQGAALRFPPGRLSKWAVLRSVGRTVPKYRTPFTEVAETAIVPMGATWDEMMTGDIDFTCRVCLLGVLNFSGDLGSFDPANQERIRVHIDFYKQHRHLITESVCHLLTPVKSCNDRTGWAVIQLQDPKHSSSLLFVFRLDDLIDTRVIFPVDLHDKQPYRIRDIDACESRNVTGGELASKGIEVKLEKKFRAAVFEIMPL